MNRLNTMKKYAKLALLGCTMALATGPAAALTDHFLIAKEFTKTMPDGSMVPMWGYAEDVGGACFNTTPVAARLTSPDCLNPVATAPGPRLTVPVGEQDVRLRLTNLLSEPTSIVIPGQKMPHSNNASNGPTWDDNSVGSRTSPTQRVRSFGREAGANGGRRNYVWRASQNTTFARPGSFLYHSGTHPQKQAYMGLYGTVTKDAAAGEAYPGVSYDNEVILFYSDIDPDFNAAVAGGTLTTAIERHPTWFLINGEPYVDNITGTTPDIEAGAAGETTLLRLISTASEIHVPVLQGMHMMIHAEDGLQYGWEDTSNATSGLSPREQYSAELPPLKTRDAIITLPAAAGRFAVYDGNGYMTNPSDPDNFSEGDEVGGMLRFLSVGAATANPPVANEDSYTVTEDTPLTIAAAGVLTNDTLLDLAPLPATAVAQLVTGPANGTLTALNPDGSFNYTPNQDVDTGDSFIYEVFDSSTGLTSDPATVTIDITAVNDAPDAQPDAYSTDEDTQLVVDAANGVLANDSDVDGDTLTATVNTAPANGNLVLNQNGSFTYTPNANFNGEDPFTYDVSDGTTTVTATVSMLTVQPVNDPPVAGADNYAVTEDTVLNVSAPGVLLNDSDVDSGPITSATLNTVTANGSLTFNTDGSFDYTPNANYSGPDGFTYDITDGTSTVTGTVTIDVTAVNDAPTITSTPVITATEAVTYNYAVTAADVDVGDTLTFSLDASPAGMTIDGTTGGISWIPDNNQTGLQDVTVRVTDDGVGNLFATQSFQIDVSPAGGPPIVLYFSVTNNGTVSGITYADEDILSLDSNGDLAMFFDGSVAGVGQDVFGFDLLPDGNTLLMAFNSGQTLPGGVSVTNHDIVAYDMGAGTFSVYFDGSDVGLGGSADRLDGFNVLADGSIVFSMRGNPTVPGVTGDADEDLLRFIPTNPPGPNTAGTWEMYFDASDVGIGGDTNAVAVAGNGDIYLSNNEAQTISGVVTGQNEDVLICSSPATGPASACAGASLFFDGSANGIGSNVDAIDLP